MRPSFATGQEIDCDAIDHSVQYSYPGLRLSNPTTLNLST